jgi:hypothetical protein
MAFGMAARRWKITIPAPLLSQRGLCSQFMPHDTPGVSIMITIRIHIMRLRSEKTSRCSRSNARMGCSSRFTLIKLLEETQRTFTD